MDRILIKRLVSRAEIRAAAIEGGENTMQPIIEEVINRHQRPKSSPSSRAQSAPLHTRDTHAQLSASPTTSSLSSSSFDPVGAIESGPGIFSSTYQAPHERDEHPIEEGVEEDEEEEAAAEHPSPLYLARAQRISNKSGIQQSLPPSHLCERASEEEKEA